MSRNNLQQDGRVDHKSSSVHWYQHRSSAKSGNQLGHGPNLGNDNIASLHFSVNVWFAGRREPICGSLLSVVRGCGQPLDSWPDMDMSDMPVEVIYRRVSVGVPGCLPVKTN